jgi:hypothetical protein
MKIDHIQYFLVMPGNGLRAAGKMWIYHSRAPDVQARDRIMRTDRVVKSRRVRWAGYVARRGYNINSYGGLVGKREGTVPFGRPRRRWKNSVQINLKIDRKWIEIIWLIIWQSGGLLSGRLWKLNHHKMWGIAWLSVGTRRFSSWGFVS